jgi:hypothetical protein
MPRYTRNMLLLAKVETTAGTDAAPVAGTDAVLLAENVDITPMEISYAQRKLLLPYFGGSLDLLGTYYSKISFSCEAAGSGTAGTAAEWSDLLLGCGVAQASLTAPVRIESTPISTALKTLTLYLYDDGVLHKLVGAMGSAKFSAKIGETPKWQFDFIGAYSPVTAVALPAATLTAWKVPKAMNKANVVDVTLGCTYATGALAGGTVFGSNGIDIDFGNKTSFFATLSSERAELTDRDSKASFELELTAAQEVTAVTDMIANNTVGLGFIIGSVAGEKIIVFAPSLQRTSVKKVDKDGIRLLGFDAKLVPSAGNDEWRFVQL